MRTYLIYPEEFPEPWASDWGEDEYGLWMGFTYKGVRQLFRWIMPGTFLMGSPEYEPERSSYENQHLVTISQGYWLAESCVTQALWTAVMRKNPSVFKEAERPVENVTWTDAQDFIDRMNYLKPELKLSLPTEAQWEYACRAGTTTPFYFGQQIISELVNFNGTAPYNGGKSSKRGSATIVVKTLPPNGWGLYEMHGNVWEWCQDWYGNYPTETVIDPSGPEKGSDRVLRGGSWIIGGRRCRSAHRAHYHTGLRYNGIGFRLARVH